jgi:oligoribonuclease (3'-5' exoribonuclease)
MDCGGRMTDKKTIALFLDLETTGLGEDVTILELGAILYDLQRGQERQVFHYIRNAETMRFSTKVNPFVYEMHKKNGLWGDMDTKSGASHTIIDERTGLPSRSVHTEWGLYIDPEPSIELRILESIEALGFTKGEIVLAGSSVHVDKRWLQIYMPRLEAFLSYRIIDVSSFKQIAKIWGKQPIEGVEVKKTEPAHRALDDCRESIATLEKFRHLFVDFELAP